MERVKKNQLKLIVMDIDNTVFDWVEYYTKAFLGMLKHVSNKTDIPIYKLCEEAKEVFRKEGSIEYPFLLQELPSVLDIYGSDVDFLLEDLVEASKNVFLDIASSSLKLYPTVFETLSVIAAKYQDIPIVALTDAPRYVAMWKLRKLGILEFFDSIYGLQDPRVPVCQVTGKVKVSQKILLKHLDPNRFTDFKGVFRALPDAYEKPGIRGMKTVLMDYGLDKNREDHRSVLWLGDNLSKDVKLGKEMGLHTIWARYGVQIAKNSQDQLLKFSPKATLRRNQSTELMPSSSDLAPDSTINQFSEVLPIIENFGA